MCVACFQVSWRSVIEVNLDDAELAVVNYAGTDSVCK